MTATEKKGCCEKCLDYDHDGGRYCFLEKDCPCHQTPIQEGEQNSFEIALEVMIREIVSGKKFWKEKERLLRVYAEAIASSEQRTRNEVVDFLEAELAIARQETFSGENEVHDFVDSLLRGARNLPTKLK